MSELGDKVQHFNSSKSIKTRAEKSLFKTLVLITWVIFNLHPIYAHKRGDVGEAEFCNYINLNCYYITRGQKLAHRRSEKKPPSKLG